MITQTSQPVTAQRKRTAKKRVPWTPEQIAARNKLRADKFVELAVHRTNNAIRRISQLISLGNRNQYVYTPEQAAKIVDVLRDAVSDVERAFAPGAKQSYSFTL